jgi:hypothetical protein
MDAAGAVDGDEEEVGVTNPPSFELKKPVNFKINRLFGSISSVPLRSSPNSLRSTVQI